jgi:hypothetical protein
MKNIYYKMTIILMFVIFSCSEEKITGLDYGTVKGKVVVKGTNEPLTNVKVFSNPNSSIVFTDENGDFIIQSVLTGQYSFQAQKEGYVTKFEPATVNNGGETEIIFELELSSTNNMPPSAPALISPSDEAVDQDVQINLTWSATDNEDDTLIYEITLRNNRNNNVVVYPNINTMSYLLENLMYNTKYFWQVSASDGVNAPVYSVTKSFNTVPIPVTRFLYVKKIIDKNVIFANNAEGTEIQLTSLENNSWRPRKNNESNKIAFIRANGSQNHIYTMNPDGTGIFKVTASVPIAGFNSDYINFSWNTAGDQIIYPNFNKLFKINADGSGLTQIYQTPNGKFISECEWSYDGSKIALKVNNANGYGVEIYVIDASGVLTSQVISGELGAMGSINFSISGQKLLFTRDVSGFENPSYRQLDARIFVHDFVFNVTTEVQTQKPSGTIDIDVRYAPNEAELIFVNTSNDMQSVRNIQKFGIGTTNSRVTLFTNASMPDWE